MERIALSEEELEAEHPGEAITFASVMAIMVVAMMAVVVYRVFKSSKGSIKLPGGYGFEWK